MKLCDPKRRTYAQLIIAKHERATGLKFRSYLKLLEEEADSGTGVSKFNLKIETFKNSKRIILFSII
jgi:hypothetical protein